MPKSLLKCHFDEILPGVILLMFAWNMIYVTRIKSYITYSIISIRRYDISYIYIYTLCVWCTSVVPLSVFLYEFGAVEFGLDKRSIIAFSKVYLLARIWIFFPFENIGRFKDFFRNKWQIIIDKTNYFHVFLIHQYKTIRFASLLNFDGSQKSVYKIYY